MEPIEKVEGRAIPFGLKNVDTDVIIPAKWLKTISREGLGQGAFETLRACLLYTSDAADERSSVDLGGRRIIKKKKR